MDLGLVEIGVTPAWWQIMKGLHSIGLEVLAVPYYGKEVHSLWWKTLRNPNRGKSLVYQSFESFMARLPNYRTRTRFRKRHAALLAKIARRTASPKWRRFLEQVMASERDLGAVILFNIPLNQLVGIFRRIRERYDIPIIAYDGDLPTSLPRFGGISSSPYAGADLTEFDGHITNSKGVVRELREMGAQRVFTIYYGADPEAFCPIAKVDADIDIAFYGVGSAFRESAMKYMIDAPSNALQQRRFVVSGPYWDKPLGRAKPEKISYRELVSRSRINLNIVRDPHAKTYASSTSRPFELAAMGSCVVSNPYEGIEEWFKPGREIFVVKDEEDAAKTYEWLIDNDSIRMETGQAARKRVIDQHTYTHRAREVLEVIKALQ
jgi:glycosyltransferase involved in cell wall biosynthesis